MCVQSLSPRLSPSGPNGATAAPQRVRRCCSEVRGRPRPAQDVAAPGTCTDSGTKNKPQKDPGTERAWGSSCSWLILQLWAGLFIFSLSKHQRTPLPPHHIPPGQAPSWASWASRASLSGVGARPGQDSVRLAPLGVAGAGEGTFNRPPIPRIQEGPGLYSSRISKVAD